MWDDVRQLNALAVAAMVLVAVACVVAAIMVGARQPMFDLKRIVVRGDVEHVHLAAVRADVVPLLKGNFFTLDLGQARRAFETLPWVRRASVSRHWPGILMVELEEHRPVAQWLDGRGLNAHGELFAVNAGELEQYADLPVLDGPEGSESMLLQRWGEIKQWFGSTGHVPTQVILSERHAWHVELDDGTQLELGREHDATSLEQRVRRYVSTYEQVKRRWGGEIKTVDLRYPNGYAVRVAGVKFLNTPDAVVR